MNLTLALLACATCYGAPDAPMTHGLNAGILTLLGVTGVVLGGMFGMMVHLGRRARQQPGRDATREGIQTPQNHLTKDLHGAATGTIGSSGPTAR